MTAPLEQVDPSTSIAEHRKARGVILRAIRDSLAFYPLFCRPLCLPFCPPKAIGRQELDTIQRTRRASAFAKNSMWPEATLARRDDCKVRGRISCGDRSARS